MREVLRVGAGAGFSGDRLEPAAVLAEGGGVDYLVLECLGERIAEEAVALLTADECS